MVFFGGVEIRSFVFTCPDQRSQLGLLFSAHCLLWTLLHSEISMQQHPTWARKLSQGPHIARVGSAECRMHCESIEGPPSEIKKKDMAN